MKILITIPHFYKKDEKSIYASSYMSKESRVDIFRTTIKSIFDILNTNDAYINSTIIDNKLTYYLDKANINVKNNIDICICTYKDFHLLDMLDIPNYKYNRISIVIDSPRYLGFGCLKVLKDNVNNYDYYCFMEDDLVLHDSYFFQKLAWFENTFGTNYLLQPHRYTINLHPRFKKIYCDPELHRSLTYRWINFNENLNLEAIYLGQYLKFIKPTNPHSGSFFLSSKQFSHMIKEKSFGIPTSEFISPIESAPTLSIMKSFNIYKSSNEYNNFFEIEHNGYRQCKFNENSNIVTYDN